MDKRILLLASVLAPALLSAHPMGNFSVSHYARFEPKAHEVEMVYVLDLAELPTFDLLRQWGLDRTSPHAQLQAKANAQARDWLKHLDIRSNGKPVKADLAGTQYVLADGAGDLPILRITSHIRLHPPSGTIAYEDHNFEDRAGWKEIVIRPAPGATLAKASQTAQDRSQALSAYPQDPTVAPPQDVRASFEWTAEPAVPVAGQVQPTPAPVIAPIPQPKAPAAVAPATMTPQSAPAGTVVKGDYLSRLLHQRELSFGMILIAIAAAFGLGAAHALTPGHGKTIVAAYLVGSRGTLKHAAFLGAMVTFTHTISVFALGLATLFLFQYVMPEKITQALGVLSGLSIVGIGGWMLWSRLRGARAGHSHEHSHGLGPKHSHVPGHTHEHGHAAAPVLAAHSHSHDPGHSHTHSHAEVGAPVVVAHSHSHDHPHTHDHDHPHPHTHDHAHTYEHPHTHEHAHGKLVHSHGPGGHVHSHDVPDEITWGSLTALAVSGGLVPCESALVLLLSAIALGRIGLGLVMLIAFSLGLALVLVAIGMLVIYAKHLLPESKKPRHPAFRWIPVASAAVVTLIGVAMTLVSLGWVQSKWMI